jgi:hypothetical protein
MSRNQGKQSKTKQSGSSSVIPKNNNAQSDAEDVQEDSDFSPFSVGKPTAAPENPDTIAILMNAIQALTLQVKDLQVSAEAKAQDPIAKPAHGIQVPSYPSNPFGHSVEPQVPAAVDDKSKLPDPIRLKGVSVESDVFIEWKTKVVDAIEGIARYRPLLLNEPKEGWEEFQYVNSKYPPTQLERIYLEAQRSLWAFLVSCLDENLKKHITDEMKQEQEKFHLPSILGFTTAKDDDFYKDCYSLMDKLTSRFNQQNGWKAHNLITEWMELRYKPGTDPMVFIQENATSFRKLRTIIPEFPELPDSVKALMLLGKLPAQFNPVKTKFLDPKELPTMAAVQTALTSWWQIQSTQQKPKVVSQSAHAVTNKQEEGKSWTTVSNKRGGRKSHHKGKPREGEQIPRSTKKETSDEEFTFPLMNEEEANAHVAYANSSGTTPQYHQVLIDSGATSHFTGRIDLIADPQRIPDQKIATVVGTKTINTQGKMKITKNITLDKVKHIPGSIFSLLSVPQVCNAGFQVLFTKSQAVIVKPGSFKIQDIDPSRIVLTAPKDGNLYTFNVGKRPAPNNEEGNFKWQRAPMPDKPREDQPCPPAQPNRKIPTYAESASVKARTELQNQRTTRSQDGTSTAPAPPNSGNRGVAAAAMEEVESKDEDDGNDSDCGEYAGAVITRSSSKPTAQNPVTPKSVDMAIQTNLPAKVCDEGSLWHSRIGHQGPKVLEGTNHAYNLGLSKACLEYQADCNCLTCISCKAKKAVIGIKTANPSRKAKAIMDCWHVDLAGPFAKMEKNTRLRLPSIEGKTYILVIVDEFSRYVMAVPITKKSDGTAELIAMIKRRQVSSGKTLKRLHSDGGGEFLNKILMDFLKSQGTELTTTTPNTPALNGIVERMIQTLSTIVRCLLKYSNAPQELWCHAFLYAAHLYNRCSQPAVQGNVPARIMHGNAQDFNLDKVKVFGCDAHPLIEEGKRGKLQSRTKPGIFVGYNEQHNAFKVLLVDSLEIIVDRNVTFNESSFINMQVASPSIARAAAIELTHNHAEDKEWEVEAILGTRINSAGKTMYLVKWKRYPEPTEEPLENLTNCSDLIEAYEARQPSPAYALGVTELVSTSNYIVPQTYNQALKHPDREQWLEAMKAEIESMQQYQVFVPVILPPGRTAIDTRWVFATKTNSLNEITKLKARIVVKGFRQEEGVDYFDTFSPTVRIKSIKFVLALAAELDLEIKQLDYNTAFLNAKVQEEIFVTPPPGYPIAKGMVFKLNKALYGLKQAPREWWLELDTFLNTLGYKATPLDECLYMKMVGEHRIYLTLYVDDTLAIYPKQVEHVWLMDKEKISTKYAIKDLGDCSWILNMAIQRDRPARKLFLSQQAYIQKVLESNGMEDCKPASTPYWVTDLSRVPAEVTPELLDPMEMQKYQSIVGSLLYAANITRIDLAYIVGLLGRFTSQPYNYHLVAARHVLKYLRGTAAKCLVFGPADQEKTALEIYTDSNWANESDDRKSTGGHVTIYNGRPISWQSKKQKTIALSSTEAEYYALGEAVREAIFMKQWFKFYCGKDIQIHVKCDNQGALHIADHTTNHNRTKHIDIQHFFVREFVKNGTIKLSYVSTREQLADILTKATAKDVLVKFRDILLSDPIGEITKQN